MLAKELSVEELENLENKGLSILQFYGNWCTNSKIVKAEIQQVIEKNETIKFLRFNVDDSIEITRKFKVNGVPTILILNDNNIISKKSGLIKQKEIEALLSFNSER